MHAPRSLFFAAAATSAVAQTYVAPGLGYFVLNSIAPTNDSMVSFSAVNAEGGLFFIGKGPKTTCTQTCCGDDNVGSSTVLYSGSDSISSGAEASDPSTLALSTFSGRETKVQKIYIAGDGSLRFTEPGAEIPDGSIYDTFEYAPEATRSSYGSVAVAGREWRACQVDSTVWQIFSDEEGTNLQDGCFAVPLSTRPWWFGITAGEYQ